MSVTRVLHVIDFFHSRAGGTARVVQTLTVENYTGFENSIYSNKEEKSDLCTAVNVFNGNSKSDSKYGASLRSIVMLNKLIRDNDIVIIHGIWQSHSLISGLICKIYGKKYYIFTHGMCDRWFSKNKRKLIKKYIYWMIFERLVFKYTTGLIVTGELERQNFEKSFLKDFPENQIYKIPLGSLDLRKLHRNTLCEPEGHLRNLIFIGRIDPKKGLEQLLNALKGVKFPFKLTIIGKGEKKYQSMLENLVKQNGFSERVDWQGPRSIGEIARELANSDLLCVPSHQENFGLVVAEAMSMDVDVLIGENVQIKEYLPKSMHVRICKPKSADIRNILELWNSEFRGKENENRKLYEDNFEPVKFRKRFYEAILKNV